MSTEVGFQLVTAGLSEEEPFSLIHKEWVAGIVETSGKYLLVGSIENTVVYGLTDISTFRDECRNLKKRNLDVSDSVSFEFPYNVKDVYESFHDELAGYLLMDYYEGNIELLDRDEYLKYKQLSPEKFEEAWTFYQKLERGLGHFLQE